MLKNIIEALEGEKMIFMEPEKARSDRACDIRQGKNDEVENAGYLF